MSPERPRGPGGGKGGPRGGGRSGGKSDRVDPRSRREGGEKRGRPPRDAVVSSGGKSRSGPRRPSHAKSGTSAAGGGAAAPRAATMTTPGGPMRIQRALARAGVASRRHAEELITAGRVTVNGAVAQTGQVVDPERDAIAVDGTRIEAPTRTAEWIVLNKPSGVLTTRTDPEGRPTIFGLVPDLPGLTYVGRLDYLTEGVLLLTTDGAAANALTHPSNEVERTYVAIVRGEAGRAAREAVRGVQLEDGEVKAVEADASPIGKGRWEFRVVLTEGRNREVRRLCEALGLTVERLVRTRFGPVSLGALEPGKSRPLSVTEGRAIKELARRRRPARPTE